MSEHGPVFRRQHLLGIEGLEAYEIEDLLERADAYAEHGRQTSKKLDLLRWLNEWSGAANDDMAPRLLPYLGDHAEDVRYFTSEALARLSPERIGPALIEALVNPEEEAGRFKRRLSEILEQIRREYPTPEKEQILRAVQALELGGSEEGRKLLASWMDGQSNALLTSQAGEAVARMKK